MSDASSKEEGLVGEGRLNKDEARQELFCFERGSSEVVVLNQKVLTSEASGSSASLFVMGRGDADRDFLHTLA